MKPDDVISSKEFESNSVNNPELDSSGKVTRRAITSPQQAYSIASQLESNNNDRNALNAVVLANYNGKQPHDPSELTANSENWRSNAPTGFMSGIVDRITPAPLQAIDSARFLTSASLEDGTPESEKKSEFFRDQVTRTIRGWNGWRDFLASLCQEIVLHGCAAPLNLNPYSPWPKMFRGDEVFFPEGTGQHSRTVQVVSAKEDLLIHEFCEFLKDGPEIADAAGWEFENCIEEINLALPKNAVASNQGEQLARQWQDAIREGNQGASHGGAKVVEQYHSLAIEPDSHKITHYIISRRDNHSSLFQKDDRFDSMEDVVTLFTLQPANGKYYASKGVGRMLLNLHIAIERGRNDMLDNLKLAGMMILQGASNSASAFAIRPVHPFMLIDSDRELKQEVIASNVENFIQADNQVANWAQQSVGAYLADLRSQEEQGPVRTAHEVTIDAAREAQAKTAFLARFWGQFADLISQITRRLCDPETTDESAKELQKKLKDPEQGNLTDEEIKKLSKAPAAEVVQDLTQQQNQQIIQVYPSLVGNPNVDQDRLLARFLAAAVNPKFQEDVQLTKQGQNANDSENLRQALIEREAILAGAPGIPVSPRDNHEIHLKADYADFKAGLSNIIRSAPQNPAILDHFGTALVHDKKHLEMWKEQGAKPEDTKDFEKAQNAFETVLDNVGNQLRQQKQAQEASPESVTASPASPNAQTGSTQQPESGAPTGTSEDIRQNPEILLAWVKLFPNLQPDIQRQLEQISGLEPSKQAGMQEMIAQGPNNLQVVSQPIQGGSPNMQGVSQNSGYTPSPAPPPSASVPEVRAPQTNENNA